MNDWRRLRRDMDRLARQTWDMIARGDVMGIRLREDTITESALLRLALDHPSLTVRRFNQNAEKTSGGDWEWIVGADGVGWFALRIQAKRMDELSYRQLDHPGERDDEHQFDTLIRSSAARSDLPTLPWYVFFNGWASGWPTGVSWNACPKDYPPERCIHHQLHDMGCAAAPAVVVRTLYETSGRARRRMGTHLPHSVPWSWLMGPPVPKSRGRMPVDTRPADLVARLFAWHRIVETASSRMAAQPREPGSVARGTAQHWHRREGVLIEEASNLLARNLPPYAEALRERARVASQFPEEIELGDLGQRAELAPPAGVDLLTLTDLSGHGSGEDR